MASNHVTNDCPEHEDAYQPNTKYDEIDEGILVKWICGLTSCSGPTETGQQSFHEWLKDGQILAQLMEKISPGAYSPNSPSKSRLAAKRAMIERENVNYFIGAVKAYGVRPEYIFQVPYLYEQENMYQVQMTLLSLKNKYEDKMK